MIFEIDDTIYFSKKYPGKAIKEIAKTDSGYLRDLMKKDERFILSEKCYQELMELTRGMYDDWKKPETPTDSIFDSLKPYTRPYGFDFNDEELIKLNRNRLSNQMSEE